MAIEIVDLLLEKKKFHSYFVVSQRVDCGLQRQIDHFVAQFPLKFPMKSPSPLSLSSFGLVW
jgi:hypothetical protein